MLEKYPRAVKVVVKQFPLNNHRFAFPAAMGAMAARNQGKFWEFHTSLMKHYNALNDEKILSIAKGLGLDMARYDHDSKSPGARSLVREDLSDGRRVGVRGTPSVYINGKSVPSRRLGDLPGIIAAELALLEKK